MTDIVQRWSEEARKRLVGRTVTSVRYLSKPEMTALGWDESVLVITFDDGTMVFPSRDDEGNGGGALFGQGPAPENTELVFPVIRLYLLEGPRPVPPPLVYDGPFTDRHKKMLKRVVRGEVLHGSCGRTLGELRDLGYISKMEKEYPDSTKGKAIWKVVLSKKGQSAA